MSDEVKVFAKALIKEIEEHLEFCSKSKTPMQTGYCLAHKHVIDIVKRWTMTDSMVAFFCGMLAGAVVGVFLFSVILAIKTNDLRKEKENERL